MPPAEPSSPSEPDGDDAPDRRMAITEFQRPILLEAGAGTGKTATLVGRVVCWALGPGWDRASEREPDSAPQDLAAKVLSRISAITFTEAAAAEMSNRVGKALREIQALTDAGPAEELTDDDLPTGFHVDVLPADRSVWGPRTRALRSSLDHLETSTIHAFCRRLLASHPLEARLDPDFTLDATWSQILLVLREVLEDYLYETWDAGTDGDLLALVARGFGPPQIEETLTRLVEAGARAEDFERDPLDDGACEALCRTLTERLEAFSPLGALVEPVPSSQLTHRVLDALATTRVILAEAPRSGRARLDVLCDRLPAAWDDKARGKLKDWRKGKSTKGEEKHAAEHIDALLLGAAKLEEALLPFFGLDPVHLQRCRKLVGSLLERLEAELHRRGLASFSDLLRDAQALLARHPAVAERERGRLEQLLVDEFQDTDALQCDIVRRLALEGAQDERPGLFLVGDPKQSIYAWRNADLAAFDDFAEELIEAGGVRLRLRRNFRSSPALLAEVERAMVPTMEEIRGVQPPFVPFLPALEDTDLGPGRAAVEYWLSWSQDPVTGQLAVDGKGSSLASYEVEARAVAADVAALHERGTDWKDVALLFRATTGVEPYLLALRERGIPYIVQNDRNYYRRREVIDASALVRTVLDTNDQIALVTLLRSPLVGVPDAALLPLWKHKLPAKLAWLRRPDPEALDDLARSIRAAAEEVPTDVPGLESARGWEESLVAATVALAHARASFEEQSADAWIETLRRLFMPEVLEASRFLGTYRLVNLERFFRELLKALEERAGDVTSILRTLRTNLAREREAEAGRPAEGGEDAVQVMTMHASKGLEFEHVYLVQLHRKSTPPRGESADFDRRGDLATYAFFGTQTPDHFTTLRQRELAESAERVRLLYVAMTRAARRLVMVGNWVPGGKKPWRGAQHFAQLLGWRADAETAVGDVAARVLAEDDAPVVDRFDVPWRAAVHVAEAGTPPRAGEEETPAIPDPREVGRVARALSEARQFAEEHARRPVHRAASAEAHTEAQERRADRGQGTTEGEEGVGRDVALAAGIAVHRALELFDPLAEEDPEVERLGQILDETVEGLVGKADREPARDRARELFSLAVGAGFLGRLRDLGERLLARELSVLLPPRTDGDGSDPGPVGFVSGTIDLLYEDEDGTLVIADYKSDRVEAEEDLADRARRYGPQGAVYVSAIQDALGLEHPPRFELWFLHAGRVLTVPPA